MAKCDICGKGVTFGIKVSHSHRRSNRAWKPNVKPSNGQTFTNPGCSRIRGLCFAHYSITRRCQSASCRVTAVENHDEGA